MHPVTIAQAVEAANGHAKDCCECKDGKPPEYRPCVMANYLRSTTGPAVDAEFDLTFFLRNVLSQGGAIRQDFANKPYEEYARRLDCAAVERAKELTAAIGGRVDDGKWREISVSYTTDDDGLHIGRNGKREASIGFANVGEIVDAAKKLAAPTEPAK